MAALASRRGGGGATPPGRGAPARATRTAAPTAAPPRTHPARGSTAPRSGAFLLATLLAVAVVLATQYGYALRVPFMNDDYVFLDKTRAASFVSLWLPRQLAFHWYRPWSRELHYWALQRLFGTGEAPYHVVSLALILAAAGCYAALARRLAGPRAAAIAVAGLFGMAAWSVPAVWVAGVQDVWMLLFCGLTLLAVDAGRRGLAGVACALALLSKETAAMLPAIATAMVWLRRGHRPAAAWRETAGLWAVLLAWAAVHPLVGGRLFHAVQVSVEPGLHPSSPVLLARTLLALASLDQMPRPAAGWPQSLLRGAPAALALAGLVAWAIRSRRPPAVDTPSLATGGEAPRAAGGEAAGVLRSEPGLEAVAIGAAWAALAWLPLSWPAIGWHAYYALFGALGAWLALGTLLARRPALAVTLVAALALVRSARATTPSLDWGSEFYQTRAAVFMASMRGDLMRLHPSLPPSSRAYFARVPSQVGFLTGDAPVLRVWYGDPTLSGGYISQYRAAPPDAEGADFFFRYDPGRGWVDIVPDARDTLAPGDTIAALDTQEFAAMFARANQWSRAAVQYERLARARPDAAEAAMNAGVAHAMAGDSARAAAWLVRAVSAPAAPESLRGAAREMLRDLRLGVATVSLPTGR